MNVLSLFDGMSCGRVALQRAGMNVTNYYAAEIDKYAIKIAQKNHPHNIQLGCAIAVRKMAEAGMFGHIDLLIAGSPCQGFSFAGKQLAFEDPRSQLFFEFVWTLQALRKHNPDIKFMLENVKMKKQFIDVITGFLGVEPVIINSALVSAQNRVRYYWANWPITQPADRGIYLRDIVEPEGQPLSDAEIEYMNRQVKGGRTHWDFKHHSDTDEDKSATLVANLHKGVPYNVIIDRGNPNRQLAGIAVTKNGIRPYKNDGKKGSFSEIGTIGMPDTKSAALTVSNTPKVIVGVAERGRGINPETGARDDNFPPVQQVEIRDDGKANCLTTKTKDSMVGCIRVGTADDIKGHDYNKRVYSTDGKAPTLASASGGNLEPKIALDDINYRKLTCIECERLQTLPDGYTEGVSNSQRYKMLGNGWNAETIAHIFFCLLMTGWRPKHG